MWLEDDFEKIIKRFYKQYIVKDKKALKKVLKKVNYRVPKW